MATYKPMRKKIPRDCVVKRRNVRGCTVSFVADKYRSPELIDMECVSVSKDCSLVGEEDDCCDFLFFGRHTDDNRLCVGVVEVKSKNPRISKAIEQLQAGADHVAQLVHQEKDIHFDPVFVWKASMPEQNIKRIRGTSIKLFGIPRKIAPQKGGVRFPLEEKKLGGKR